MNDAPPVALGVCAPCACLSSQSRLFRVLFGCGVGFALSRGASAPVKLVDCVNKRDDCDIPTTG